MRSVLFFILFLISSLSFSTLVIAGEEANHQAKSHERNHRANKDGEIIATLIVINEHEIAAADEASKRNVKPMVKEYADMLQKDHTKNLHDTQELGDKIGQKPTETDAVTSLKQKGDKELAKMKPLNDEEFQIVYIDSMIKGHADALKKIDQGIKHAHNDELKNHLKATRGPVKHHLEEAKKIKEKIKSKQS